MAMKRGEQYTIRAQLNRRSGGLDSTGGLGSPWQSRVNREREKEGYIWTMIVTQAVAMSTRVLRSTCHTVCGLSQWWHQQQRHNGGTSNSDIMAFPMVMQRRHQQQQHDGSTSHSGMMATPVMGSMTGGTTGSGVTGRMMGSSAWWYHRWCSSDAMATVAGAVAASVSLFLLHSICARKVQEGLENRNTVWYFSFFVVGPSSGSAQLS